MFLSRIKLTPKTFYVARLILCLELYGWISGIKAYWILEVQSKLNATEYNIEACFVFFMAIRRYRVKLFI